LDGQQHQQSDSDSDSYAQSDADNDADTKPDADSYSDTESNADFDADTNPECSHKCRFGFKWRRGFRFIGIEQPLRGIVSK
jgi:hypothetical protein